VNGSEPKRKPNKKQTSLTNSSMTGKTYNLVYAKRDGIENAGTHDTVDLIVMAY
jgi:hypothetical protein